MACHGEIQMGIGRLGGSQLVFKRKFRWTLMIEDICGSKKVPEYFVKVASRPNLTVEETQIDYLNGRTWIPGKGAWETMEITYYDVHTNDNMPLFDWIATVYDFTDPVCLNQASQRKDYAGRGTLKLYDGCGNALEKWILNDMWPTAVNFGELDYSSSDVAEITLTVRYSSVAYKGLCGIQDPQPCCSQCTGTTGNWQPNVG